MLTGKGLVEPLQKDILALFASLPNKEQLYLTNGTALAEFYLGHRLSYHLDFFTGQAGLVVPTSFQIEQRCAELGLDAGPSLDVLPRMWNSRSPVMRPASKWTWRLTRRFVLGRPSYRSMGSS